MAELPWFKMYPGDWLASQRVQLLTLHQEGAFFRLLCYAWLSPACALPKDERTLKRLCKWDDVDEDFTPVLSCFQPSPSDPDQLYHPRLYKEWELAKVQQAMMTHRAQKGAQVR